MKNIKKLLEKLIALLFFHKMFLKIVHKPLKKKKKNLTTSLNQIKPQNLTKK